MNPLDVWNALPPDLKSFIISVTANIVVPGGKRGGGDGDERHFNAALHHGLARFALAMGDRCYASVPAMLEKEEMLAFLLSKIHEEVGDGDDRHVKDLIYRNQIPMDTATLEGIDLEGALRAFVKGFQAVAEKNSALIPYLNRGGIETVRVSVERMDGKLDLVNRRLEELVTILRTIQTGASMSPDVPDLEALRKLYFGYLKSQYEYLSFKGFTEGKLISMPLREIFTELDFWPNGEREDKTADEEWTLKIGSIKEMKIKIPPPGWIFKADDILSAQLAVVTGGPGAGKSTLLRRFALDLIEASCSETGAKSGMLPVVVPVIAYAEARKTHPCPPIRDFIPLYFEAKDVKGIGPLLHSHWEEGRTLFMFDGLDEVTDEAERQAMVEAVRNCVIADGGRGNRFIVTCRTASYKGSTRFDPVNGRPFSHFRTQPFGEEQIRSFLLSWYRWFEREIHHNTHSSEKAASAKRDAMVGVIEADQNLKDLAANPLMLTILALIEHEKEALPQDRAKLYEKCLDMLTGRWERLRSEHAGKQTEYSLGDRKITSDTVIEFLGPIAWRMIEEDRDQIDYRDLKEDLAKHFDSRNSDMGLSRQQAKDFICLMGERSGILQEIATRVYGFIMHRTFIEYLAARWLADVSEDRMKDLGDNLFKDGWREVVKLATASLVKRDATNLVRDIMNSPHDLCGNLILAGECILDVGRDSVHDSLYDDLIGRLVETLNSDHPPAARASAGEVLGRLGDPRKDLTSFVLIRDGRYNMPDIGFVEIGPFEIGKYPVTNGWFAEFWRAGGYGKPEFWSPNGAKWLEQTGATYPLFWNDRKWNCSNAPVVGVCWWEADAFCRWLTRSRNDEWMYCLPSDGQWYAAAAGKEEREYPWGEWKEGACNSQETKIEKTTSVGIFPAGDTPKAEVSDMAGNVWEWTRSDYHIEKVADDFDFDPEVHKLFDLWESTQDQEKKHKVAEIIQQRWEKETSGLPSLRGGSWYYFRDGARCAVRFWNFPNDRGSYVGFRCARTQK